MCDTPVSVLVFTFLFSLQAVYLREQMSKIKAQIPIFGHYFHLPLLVVKTKIAKIWDS